MQQAKLTHYILDMSRKMVRYVDILFHDCGTIRMWGSASRLGRNLPPRKIQYPFYRRLCGNQGRSGRTENLICTVIPTQTSQKWVPETFPLVKAAGSKGWQTYYFEVPTVLKSGSLRLLDTSESLHVCNGTDFLLIIAKLQLYNDTIIRLFVVHIYIKLQRILSLTFAL